MAKITPQTIHKTDSNYPGILQHIAQPPKTLYILGGSLDKLLEAPCLGVVGSRKSTPYGRAVTEDLVKQAASHGVTIISGLALGIDSVAHRAALSAGGKTIAVLPTSVEEIYPPNHHQLAKEIIEKGGALVTEYLPGTPPLPQNFIARNRIIAGLSKALLVTEAAEKSGSLHTARFALEQGKNVLAVPGDIDKPNSAGTNNLIKSGATPVTRLEDILEALGVTADQQSLFRPNAETKEEQAIIDILGEGAISGRELLAQSELPADLFQQTLTMLEITGRIRPLGNDHWSLK